jgi:hypothetical protein
VLVADLRDRYAHLRRVLSRHLDRLYIAGHVVLVSYSVMEDNDCMQHWRFQQRFYPGVTGTKLDGAYARRHAIELAQNARFYAGHENPEPIAVGG